jgi:hypothetical protein
VSHPCHQCGVEVDEGSPFCRKCGAPQIRVSRGDDTPAASPAAPAAGAGGFVVSESPRHGGVDRSVARSAAAKAGILVAILLALSYSISPFFLLVPFAGILAVQLYLKRVPGRKLSPGEGAGVGLLAGFLGFLIWGIPYLVVMLWCLKFHPDWPPIQNLRAQIDIAARIQVRPEAQQLVQQWLTPGGLIFVIVLVSISILIFTLILSAIGGAIGAGIARRRP